MAEGSVYTLTNYPLQETLARCDEIANSFPPIPQIRLNDWYCMDVSRIIGAFPHLCLCEGHRLAAYFARGYHGVYGHIAALPAGGELPEAFVDGEGSLTSLILPNNAADPMEVVCCDGTPEGWFEAVLLDKWFFDFPRLENVLHQDEEFIFSRPELPPEHWNIWLDPQDWTPKVELLHPGCRMLLFQYRYENGFESSSGLDSVSLNQYLFAPLFLMKHGERAESRNPLYRKCYDLRRVFPAGYQGCIFSRTSITLASQRER